ncbi:MAG: 16S rRNA (guanine(527)-N(7))-methyltransferase RsmG [Candidatus Limnocylindrales bacterium]
MTDRRDPLPTDVASLPPLPSGYLETLDAGLVELGLHLDPDARSAIDDHVRLLLAWTAAINLTAIREPTAVARDHVLDSLSAVAVLRSGGARTILDLGSGGGYPGIPLAIAVPAERTVLVESVGKKATFLATVLDALELRPRLAVAATRAETLAADRHHRERWDAVTARAVGPLADLIELGLPLAAPGGAVIAWKRRTATGELGTDGELAAAERAADVLGGGRPRIVPIAVGGLADHVLVVVEKEAPTPAGWPRDPATRRRRPW